MLRALLFDLDDTLYGFSPCNEAGIAAAHAVVAAELDVSAPAFRALHDDVRAELARRLPGQPDSHDRVLFFKHIVERLTGACRPDLSLRLVDAYWRTFLDTLRPAPGVQTLLEQLAERWPLALLSNQMTEVQLRKLRRLGLEGCFPIVVTSEEVGVDKPDPRVFRRALAALGVEPAESAMIGDDPDADMRGAAALGMRTVRTRQFVDRPMGAQQSDAVIASLDELPAALAAMLAARSPQSPSP